MTPEEKLNYPVTERTRFKVRIEIYAGLHPARPGVKWIRTIKTLHDCQRHYVLARDASGLGGSQFGDGEVFDEQGQYIARISYNGRLWSTDVWVPGMEFVAEAPDRERIAP
jgi:hypothetical protein